jgi:succinate dehydrogenase hydrophobic anchor subunit
MRVGGHRMREHVRLLLPLFAFLLVVWLLRLLLAAAGASLSVSRVFSVTTASAVAVFLAVLLIHFHGFGGYTNVVTTSLLLNAWSQVLIVIAILVAVVTGTENVYTLPEFSVPGDDPLHLRHIFGHLTFMLGLGTLFGAGVGCLMLWFLRLMVPMRREKAKGL